MVTVSNSPGFPGPSRQQLYRWIIGHAWNLCSQLCQLAYSSAELAEVAYQLELIEVVWPVSSSGPLWSGRQGVDPMALLLGIDERPTTTW